MLNLLSINNLAIVDSLELEPARGLTVITGETGAGKSIMIDALALCLGARADSGLVRHQSDKSQIGATFSISDNKLVADWLEQRELCIDTEEGEIEECIIRRVISKDGRSRAFINNQAVPLSDLKELGELLVSVHSQHQHQQLTRKDTQMSLLDGWAGLDKDLNATREAWNEWQKVQRQFEAMKNHQEDYLAKVQLLEYQVEELDKLEPQEGEFDKLAQEQSLLANADETLATTQQCCVALSESDDAIAVNLNKIIQQLEQLKTHDSFSNAVQLLKSAQIQIEEASSDIRLQADRIDLDPERLALVEERLTNYHQQARKHLLSPSDLPNKYAELKAEFEALGAADNQLDALQARCEAASKHFHSVAKKLSSKRSKAAKKLSAQICQSLQELEMPNADFQINGFAERGNNPSAYGIDDIEFFISMNTGQPAQALSKVASGGELSRISLAIQVLVAEKTSLPCLIFDEVDVGVGGATAEVVGRKLRELAQHCQVICVTHQAQVAVQGHQHWHVQKHQSKKSTSTEVLSLENSQRVEEIARMVGGIEVTDSTMQHAEDLLLRAQAS